MFCKKKNEEYCRCLVEGRDPIYKKLFYAGIAVEDS
jgi:hypothetical protein